MSAVAFSGRHAGRTRGPGSGSFECSAGTQDLLQVPRANIQVCSLTLHGAHDLVLLHSVVRGEGNRRRGGTGLVVLVGGEAGTVQHGA